MSAIMSVPPDDAPLIINSFIPAPVNQILTQGVIMAIINVALLIIGLIVLGKSPLSTSNV